MRFLQKKEDFPKTEKRKRKQKTGEEDLTKKWNVVSGRGKKSLLCWFHRQDRGFDDLHRTVK